MAKSVNQVILLGRLTRDAELRSTSGGKNVTEFSLAVDKGNDQAAFFDVVAWEKTAELVAQYTQKGSKVLVQGRLDQQSWEKDGKKNSKMVIMVDDIVFCDQAKKETPANDKSPDTKQGEDVPF